ncbi:uncharacterized protein MELLADRAFT_114890 [Melampsora larici-populina 98AG31]|uniref:CRA domain-containing protein n=1 Tax=Melampsora larici-populina (strain 98AG31 / pathotype 3-4-7) TaxID=747676 RepID=F4R438_MELLP|nr:uncharacterized protein MELLADRAFT_114890 [Melampsora larici-populina 98AG31]EGG13060.1 hypothetical protein MELLADRAFT_114890 [Melampsora larici-populina 98AG31]
MSQHRHLTDPSLPSTTLQPDYSNNAIAMLYRYGPKRTTDHSELRRLVLDYLCHQCFVDTAAAFAREAPVNGTVEDKDCKNTNESSLNGASAQTSKVGNSNGVAPIHLPVPLKDNVVERTVRFDTDDDGDTEMGDLTATSLNPTDEPPSDIGQPSGLDHPANAHDNSTRNGVKDSSDQFMLDGPAVAPVTSISETYPDWTASDIHNTQLRLLIKDNIISGRLKEAIGLIDLYFPAVLGPSALSKLHTTSLSASTTASATSAIKSSKAPRQKPARVMFNVSRPLGGPTPKPPPIGSRQPSYSSAQSHATQPRQTTSWSSSFKEPEAGLLAGRNNTSSNAEEFPHAMFSSLQPAHIALNLQIQYFVELVRNSSHAPSQTTTLENDHVGSSSTTNGAATTNLMSSDIYASLSEGNSGGSMNRPVSANNNHHLNKTNDLATSIGALSDDTSTSSSSTMSSRTHSIALSLPHARSLFCYVQTLPKPNERAIFVKELESVSGLLAYVDPWNSPIKRYLDQSRRDMLAEIVNAAILVHLGRSPTPILKMIAQQASFTWSTLNETGERIPCPKADDKNRTRPCNFFNLNEFVSLHDTGGDF